LTKLEDPPAAAKLADESLSRAILLSEELAMFHMELLVNRRRQSGSFVRHIFGCRVDSSVQNARYRDMLSGNFDYPVLPLPWNVVAGLATNRAFTLTFEQMIEMTRLLVAQVKNVLPQARTLVTITQPYGEYHAKTATSVAPILYAEMVAQAGINFDGFALEIELGVPQPGNFMRDLFQVSALLDRFS